MTWLLSARTEAQEAGVCARVKIEIDQRLTLTRNAFKATLEVNNDIQNVPLENVAVMLDIRDKSGEPAASLFQVRDPELTNVGDVSGTGQIVPGTTAKAVWIIVPTRDAAPTADSVEYSIGGTLRYLQGEQQLTIPLYPAAITVKPDPSLVLDYFLPQRVYSDDPWTDNTERVEAFPLGLLITNKGYGEAKNVRIVSSQPKIVENLKGLLIDFKILNTQVNNGEIKPSLAVDLGTISPLQSSVARWFMTASLEGRFEEFSATFNHIDSLGNPRTSLIDHVDAHQLTHCVRITNPDDNKPDFLGNPVFDPGQHSPWLEPLPTKVWSSDGSISDVSVASNAVAPKVSTGGLVVELNATVQPGYCYLRVEDPGLERFRLVSIKRSDGAQVLLGENAWTTHRTIRLVDRTYREHNLHVFDYNSTGKYTLTYADGRLSTEVDAGEGKGLGDGSVIRLAGVQAPVVTARFPGVFYAEQASRSSGIRIEWPGQVDPGTQIDVTGELHTNQDFERYIKAFIVSPIGSAVVDPLHIVGRSIGGPDLGYDPATGQGQRGTWAYQRVLRLPDGVWVRELRPVPGLSTIGLLIATEGRVTYAEGDHFVVDDGSNMDDGDPNRPGLRVVLPPGYLPPPMGSYVRVTGVSSCYVLNGLTYRLIRVWQAGDVQMIAAP